MKNKAPSILTLLLNLISYSLINFDFLKNDESIGKDD